MAVLRYYDILLDSVPYMLARDNSGSASWTEQAPQGADPNGGGMLQDIQPDFSGGVGLTARTGTAEGQRMLASSGAATPGTLGGGVDGRWGFLMPSFETTSVTINTNDPIRDLKKISFIATPTYLAAADDQVWTSTDLVSWASSVTFAMPCLELIEDQGTNSVPLAWAAIDSQPYQTWDGTTWEMDASAAMRTGVLGGWLQTQDNGATFVDATTSVTDSTAASVATLSSYSNFASGDFVYVGYTKPFSGLTVDLVLLNTTASTLEVKYWDGATWVAVSGLVDGTSSAGSTIALGQDGTITWTRPADEWVKTKISNESLLSALFWVRLSWTGTAVATVPMDASVTVTQVDPRYREEASSWAKVGRHLYRAFDKNRVARTEDGGRKGTWFDGMDAIGGYQGQIVGLMAAADLTGQGAAYLLRNSSLGASQSDGSYVEYAPELWSAATNSDDIGYTAWLGELFFSSAARNGFYRMNPLGGVPQAIGPERLMLAEEPSAQGRITAACADASFLYAALYNPVTAKSYLWVYGTYRPELSEGGSIQTGRFDVWSMTTELGSVKVQSMAVLLLSSQPYLCIGTSTGVLLKQKLPAGIHPLDASSGCRWTVVSSSGIQPTITGDPSRKVLCQLTTVTGRNISGSNTVTIYSKEQKATSWTSQGTITASGQTLTWSSPFAGFGLDVKLEVVNASATAPTILESVVHDHRQDIKPARRQRQLPILIGDNVVRHDGVPIRRRTSDWITLVDAVVAKTNSDTAAQPVSLTFSDGSTHSVWISARKDIGLQSDGFGNKHRAVMLDTLEAT